MLNVEDYEGTLKILGKEWTVKIDEECLLWWGGVK